MSAPPRPGASDLRFPVLLPHAHVLARSNDEWQVGLEPGSALTLRGAALGPVLELLDGRHPMAVVRETAHSRHLRDRDLRAALTGLVAAGLLADQAEPPRPERRLRVRLIGAGPIGARIAELLGAVTRTLYVYDDEPPEARHYPQAGVLATRAQALCSVFAGAGTELVVLNHWSKPDGVEVDLSIVAVEAPEVDRLVTDHLVQTDAPHLVVRAHEARVSVGPLVIPGQTSCLRCADLTRRDADPRWPTVLGQLVRLRSEVPPLLLGWAAATAALQASAFLSGQPTETTGATLEVGLPDLGLRRRSWPVHPGCGCGWSATTEWGA